MTLSPSATVGALLLTLASVAQAQSVATQTKSGATPPKLIAGPPLADLRAAAYAVIATCEKDGAAVSVVILDENGAVKLIEAADGAIADQWIVAQKKALTTLTYKMDGLPLTQKIKTDKKIAHEIAAAPEKYWPRPHGARLIIRGDRIVGAIGVSGSVSIPHGPIGGERDNACATAGLERIAKE